MMQLSDWAALAEILSAAAVIVSLIFVGAQIRENTRATHAATLQDHVEYEMDLVTRVGAEYIRQLREEEGAPTPG